ncbi:MAG: YdbH domain-containing protein [Hyphomonas sp.]|nr:YdbH domain-containing protein [Hyphomonas sp.]
MRVILAAILVLVLAALAAGWILRKSVAGRALAGWCEARDLVCTANFSRLDSDGATLTGLTISGQGQVALAADEVDVSLTWPRLFTPRVTGVSVDAPVAHGALAEGSLSFHGLERLARMGGGGGGAMPVLDIRNGRILIDTSAGELGADFSVSGAFPQQGEFHLVTNAARLDEPQGRVEWREGVIDVTADAGRLEGNLRFLVDTMETDDVAVRNAEITGLIESGTSTDAPIRLVWEAEADTVRAAGYEVQALVASGQAAAPSVPSGSVDALIGLLTVFDVEVSAGPVSGAGRSAGSLWAEASLKAGEDGLTGPAAFTLTDAIMPEISAGRAEANGTVSRDSTGRLAFRADRAALTGAAVPAQVAEGFVQAIRLPAPLTEHGTSLKAALVRGLSSFELTTAGTLSLDGEGVQVSLDAATQAIAASGLTLDAAPPAGAPWFAYGAGKVALAGEFSASGGGLPQSRMVLDRLETGKDALTLSARTVSIAPWSVGGARFGADLTSLSVSREEGLSFETEGSAFISGRVFGFDLSPSRLTGGIVAANTQKGWQAAPLGAPCLAFATEGVGIGTVTFAPARLNLCPQGGKFMVPGRDGGRLDLGNLSLPFQANSVSGTAHLPRTVLDWKMKQGLALTLGSPNLSLPMDIGERTLTIDGAGPELHFVSTGKGAPRLTADLGATEFGGTLVPARLSAEAISFDGTTGAGGLAGDILGTGVVVRDFRDDPMYQPFTADMAARLDAGRLTASGPFSLKESGVEVGDFTLDINVLKLDGTARVASRALDFRKNGLQPVMLSERLRGVYTDAVGRVEAVSDVTITGGKLAGTAGITASGFGFQTTRLGRVEGINGHVQFADLFALETEEAQVLNIGGLNPGVPLRSGQIVFAYSGADGLAVEAANFPFSGGTLALSAFTWKPGAETQHIEVAAYGIDLGDLVSILKLPELEASGTVSGRFPIDFERTKVLIRDARLKADPGGGRVAYLGDAADAAANSSANVRLAFDALKDFDFTVLEVGLNGNVADRIAITLKLAGKSRRDITYGQNATLGRGQPFEFEIAVDSALAELFRSSQFYTNQQKLTDFVVREVLAERGVEVEETE